MTSRFRTQMEEALFPPIVALLVALICGDLLIMSYGQSPATVYRLLLEGTWGNAYGFGQVLYKATTLAFTGLAVSLGIRAGLFNVGAEGQLAAGVRRRLRRTTPHLRGTVADRDTALHDGGGGWRRNRGCGSRIPEGEVRRA